jgi:glycine cleavage system regulatory protein
MDKPFYDIVDPGRDTPEDILSVLTYEIGDMHKCLHRAKRYPQNARAYMAELQVTTADAMTMLHGFIQLMGWKRIDIENMGLERVQERLRNLTKEGVY